MSGFWAGFGQAFQDSWEREDQQRFASEEQEKQRLWEREDFLFKLNEETKVARENAALEHLMAGAYGGSSSKSGGSKSKHDMDTVAATAASLVERFPEHEEMIVEVAADPNALMNLAGTLQEYEEENKVRIDAPVFGQLVSNITTRVSGGEEVTEESLRESFAAYGITNPSQQSMDILMGMSQDPSSTVRIDYDYSSLPEERLTTQEAMQISKDLGKSTVLPRIEARLSALRAEMVTADSENKDRIQSEILTLEGKRDVVKEGGVPPVDIVIEFAGDEIERIGHMNDSIYNWFPRPEDLMNEEPDTVEPVSPSGYLFKEIEFNSAEEVMQAHEQGLIPANTTHVIVNGVRVPVVFED